MRGKCSFCNIETRLRYHYKDDQLSVECHVCTKACLIYWAIKNYMKEIGPLLA